MACNGYLDHPFKTRHVETEKELLSLLANRGGSVYKQTSSTASSCSLNDTLTRWRSFFYGWCFHIPPAAEEWLLGGGLVSLCSVEQTAQDLLAALHPH
jgi:hypothetical protein